MNAIVCMTKDRSIGRKNKLLYHISDDLRRFKKYTEGSVVVMGRNTFDSLPNGPLPNRINIVFTSRTNSGIYSYVNGELVPDKYGTVFVINEVSELNTLLRTHSNVWCIGGGKLYSLLMPYISRIEITEVQAFGKSSDVKFPELDPNIWQVLTVSEMLHDGDVSYIYKTATRKNWQQ